MKIVLDTNIVFSSILSPNGTINELLLNSSDKIQFYSPESLIEELNNHHQKLIKISKYSEEEILFLKRNILSKISVINLDYIKSISWEQAFDLSHDIDEFDTPFIALAIELQAPLWTGDKKLIKGLKKKNVDWIYPTEELINSNFLKR
ncbi:MAG: putative toxin-antitoxin system toxin component, PIN family [Bacteroidetes bacterium]|nr:MAG: putative toxin-antitoxin system toxin component, PIN family [Bacteroidota bacterium]